MDPKRLRFEIMRDLYEAQRTRREHIRNSVATPVAALAFSVFNLSTISTHVVFGDWSRPVNVTIAGLSLASVLTLLAGVILIIRVERNVMYLDPPDLEELVRSEGQIRAAGAENEDEVLARMHDLMAGSYDIVYRRYFAANEQAARDRTRGLHLILIALALIVVVLCLLPFQSGGGR